MSEHPESNVNRYSRPSQLKITDLRVASLKRRTLIRIDTNQGLSGYGEVRDGATPTYALLLKSRILGENPCDVDRIFRKIKQFGGPARQGGGVCGIELALWDLAGKAYGTPVYAMLGGKFHEVDSAPMDFRIAGSMALQEGARKAGVKLLEPMMEV